MQRKTPMKRTGFKRTSPSKSIRESIHDVKPVEGKLLTGLTRNPNYSSPANDPFVAVPKGESIQHQGFMRLVRMLPCAHCGIEGYSQFCHSDEGKGAGIKSDCREGWPGCSPRPGVPGCHYLIGTQRIYPKADRRELERSMAAATRKKIYDLGLWPKDLEYYA